MKAHAVHCQCLLLLVMACGSGPDSALFSGDLPASSAGGNPSPSATGGAGSGASAPGGAATAGSATAGGIAGQAPGPATEGGSPVVDAGGAGGAAPEPDDMPTPPLCGNGKLEEGEQCDDAAREGGDGCNADCEVVCSDFGTDVEASPEHHCYAGYDEADFEDAQADCVERGAHLATIASAAENEIVRDLVDSSKFIGAFEPIELMNEDAGTYEWITGEAFEYENWDGQQPDRAGDRCDQYSNNQRCYEHCAIMQGDGTWADQRCDLVDGYVCEWEPAGL
jgi:cysteine-rich repeat protein